MATRQTRRLLPVLPPLDLEVVSTAKLNGRKMDATLVNAITGMRQSLTIEGANVLALKVNDPGRLLLRRDLLGGQLDLDLGAAGRWRIDRPRDVGGLGMQGGQLELRFWCLTSAAMRAQTDPLSVSSSRMDIGGFARLLATEIKADVRPRIVVPHPGDVPDMESADTPAGGDAGKAGFSSKARLKGKVDDAGNSGYLTRAQLRDAAELLQVAADENAPPKATLSMIMAAMVEPDEEFGNPSTPDEYGSVGTFQGRVGYSAGPKGDGSKLTREEALDRQLMAKQFLRGPAFTSWNKDGKPIGAIAGAREFPSMTAGEIAQKIEGSAHPLRYDKQREHAKAIIEAWQGGSSSGGSDVVTRPAQWRRGTERQRESSWLALEREAKRLGRRRFVALPHLAVPRLVVAADQQLIRAQPHLEIDGLDDPLLVESPSIELDGIAQLQTIDLVVWVSGWSAPQGAAVHMRNCGPADGPWIVRSIDREAGKPTAQVSLQQPTTTVEAQASATTAGGGKRGTSSDGDGSLFAACKAISDRKLPYGPGGHGQGWAEAKKASTMDCSSSTSVALNEIGLMKGANSPQVSDWFLKWGVPGRGKEFTVWVQPGSGPNGHVCTLFEGEKEGWRFDTGTVDAAGRGPRLRNTPRSTAGMHPRHWQGH